MRRTQPLGLFRFTVLGAGVVTVVLISALITDAGGVWWAEAFPRELATYRLEREDNYFYFGVCAYAPSQSWQLLRDQPNAEELFDSVATRAQSAAGVVMAFAGLAVSGQGTGRAPDTTVAGYMRTRRQPMVILRGYEQEFRADTVSLAHMLTPPMLDSVITLLERDLESTPEC
ncbi:MAG TPA: hypothetical protein VFL88_01645 [Gemmatimonadales bacterium]|nr:hypothetical protein [Gemmatimonadales bacterium]